MKIILGTAQSIPGYGITNDKEYVDMNALIDKFYSLGGRDIDTAPAYADAERIIGSSLKSFNITTKIPRMKVRSSREYISNLEHTLEASLKNLNASSIEHLLIHDLESFLENIDKNLIKFIESLKTKGLIKNFGASVYNTHELDNILERIDLDSIQFPLNPFNQIFLSDRFIKLVQSKNIKTFARSIYMQGLLASEHDASASRFQKWSNNFLDWFLACQELKISPADGCLQFIKGISFLDGFIVGVTSTQELETVFKSHNNINAEFFKKFRMDDDALLDPRNWK